MVDRDFDEEEIFGISSENEEAISSSDSENDDQSLPDDTNNFVEPLVERESDSFSGHIPEARKQIISEMVRLAGEISTITNYPTKNLLMEVSKISRDQILNESIRPDYGAFRVQLFKYLGKYISAAEKKSRILSPMLIELYRTEFQKKDIQYVKSQNLLPLHGQSDTSLKTNAVSEEDGTRSKFLVANVKRKDVIQAMKALLTVFSKFSSPKTVFMESELKSIYDELLLSNDPELQNLALACLASYKSAYILPYLENLQNLLDEKKFRDELVRFTVDEQNCVVSDEHRQHLIPLIMRILYGRFHTHVAVRGKSKRMAIFAFITSCKPEELDIFFNLMFTTFLPLLEKKEGDNIDLSSTLQNMSIDYDPQKAMPLNKIRSALGNVDDFLKGMAFSLSESQVATSYSVIVICTLLTNLGLEVADRVDQHAVKMLKSLRIQAFDSLIRFFRSYRSRPLTPSFVECLFECVLEPMLISYNKKANQDSPITPISLLCNTLLANGTPKSTQMLVIKCVNSLLHAESADDVDEGINIVFPSINKILSYISMKIPSDAKSCAKIPSIYLDILNRLSPFVKDEAMGKMFATTLLRYFTGRALMRKTTKFVDVMNTIARLCVYIENLLSHLRRVSRFLFFLEERVVRDALVQMIVAFCTNSGISSEQHKFFHLLQDLESWDARRINEPDIERRHSAYVTIEKHYANADEGLTSEICQMFAYSHAHALVHIADIAIKKMASNALRQLATSVRKSQKILAADKRVFIHDHLLPLILKGLNSENEICRIESLHCLAAVISIFDNDPQFSSLKPINKDWDSENENLDANFFEAMTHIQAHRRQRAIFHLTEQLETKKVDIPHEVLLRYVVPTIKPYLLETTSKLSALSDQSLKLFSVILQITPWKRYKDVLVEYVPALNDSEKIKGAIRALSAILDGFHFTFDESSIESLSQSNSSRNKNFLSTDIAKEISGTHQNKVINESLDSAQKESKLQQDILKFITNDLLPALHDAVVAKQHQHHKKAQGNNFLVEEEELTRAPIILAGVKLMKKLPKRVMDQNLHSQISPLYRLLLSRSASVRQDTRKILSQIMQSLGPKYLDFFVKELKQTMNKGYQVHVMIYTVHTLVSVLENVSSGDMDGCFKDILEITKMELFSDLTDEKKNESIKANTPEAKSNKALETFVFMGRYLSAKYLNFVLTYMRQIMEEKPKSETARTLSQLLRGFCTGLSGNTGLNALEIVNFAAEVLKRNIGEVVTHQKNSSDSNTSHGRFNQRPQDCLLLAPEPKRMGEIVKTSSKSKVSIFVEFGFQLLNDLIKRRDFGASDDQANENGGMEALNECVPYIIDALQLKYDKIIALAMKCLISLLKYPLRNITDCVQTIVDRLFVILANYAGLGLAGNKLDMISLNQLLFKCLAQMIRKFSLVALTPKRIQILLNYAETDVLDSHKQATAFDLVRAIIGRKIVDEKVDNIIEYLSEIMITSTSSAVREQCQKAVLLYLSSHPSGQKIIEQKIEFFLNQCEYEFEAGRLASLQMLSLIIDTCSEEQNSVFALLIFVKLASCLVNDESEKCRNSVSLVLRSLLSSVNDSAFTDMFAITKDWLDSEKITIRLLAVKTFTEFLKSPIRSKTIEKKILSNSRKILNIICTKEACEKLPEDLYVSCMDFLLILMERPDSEAFANLLPSHSATKALSDALNFGFHCTSLAVRRSAIALLEQLLSSPAHKTITLAVGKGFARGFLGLCHDLCFQFGVKVFDMSLAGNVIKTLSHVIALLNQAEFSEIVNKLAKVCWKEIVSQPDQAARRLSIFKIIEKCMRQSDDPGAINTLTDKFFPLLYREMNRKSAENTDELFQMASELAEVFKSRIGEEKFSSLLIECHKQASAKRDQRKANAKAMAILDPAKEALRKQKHHERKLIARKRKIDELKPYRIAKRRRREEQETDP
ncbi:down-regulated in metastasis domain-containing protein [Ditylenchus destructor]|nr:down-regulated in metastasis domain-containing protein [Ditylenchus destructor]